MAPPSKKKGRGGWGHQSKPANGRPEPPVLAIELEPHALEGESRLVLVVRRSGKRVVGAARLCAQVPELVAGLGRVQKGRLTRIQLEPSWAEDPTWSFDMGEYDEVQALLVVHLRGKCAVLDVPFQVLENLRREQAAPIDDEALRVRCGPAFWDSLYDFQKDGVRRAIAFGGRAMIGDEMGLGKTRQGLAVGTYYVKNWPLLVLCPSILKTNWGRSFCDLSHVCSKDLPAPKTIKVVKTSKDEFADADVVIVAFSMLRYGDVHKRLMDRKFGVVIIDESHKIKNSQAQQTKLSLKLCKGAARRILLSGTLMARPEELFTQIHAVDPTVFPRLWPFGNVARAWDPQQFFFAERYCDPKLEKRKRGQTAWGWSGRSRAWELHCVLTHLMLIRRLKMVVLGDKLPAKVRERVVVAELDGSKLNDFKARMEEVGEIRESSGTIDANPAFMELVRLTAKLKVAVVCKHIRENYVKFLEEQPEQKILIFVHHHLMGDAVQKEVEAAKLRFIRIDGKTSGKKRDQGIDDFQDDASVRVAILSITAAGCGITLTAAARVVFAELSFGPKELFQAEDRSHRIGQTEDVLVEYLVLKGSTDDVLWGMVESKDRSSGLVLDNSHARLDARIREIGEGGQEGGKVATITDEDAAEAVAGMSKRVQTQNKRNNHKKRKAEKVEPVSVGAIANNCEPDPTRKRAKKTTAAAKEDNKRPLNDSSDDVPTLPAAAATKKQRVDVPTSAEAPNNRSKKRPLDSDDVPTTSVAKKSRVALASYWYVPPPPPPASATIAVAPHQQTSLDTFTVTHHAVAPVDAPKKCFSIFNNDKSKQQ